jgi:ribosome-associated heat shock protein Hsp15
LTIRIDKWLWHARFYKTRPLAQAAATSGRLRLNGNRVEKSSATVKPGDVLTLGRGREVLAVKICAIGERRGPAPEARLLYEILTDSALDPGPPAS